MATVYTTDRAKGTTSLPVGRRHVNVENVRTILFYLHRAKLILTDDDDDDDDDKIIIKDIHHAILILFFFSIIILSLFLFLYFLYFIEFARSLTLKFEFQCSLILCSQCLTYNPFFLRLQNTHCLHDTRGIWCDMHSLMSAGFLMCLFTSDFLSRRLLL